MTNEFVPEAQLERQLNDKLRREMPHGSVIIRGGAKQFSTRQLVALTELIQEFDDPEFDCEASDLHNYGALTFQGVDVVWRIEARDREQSKCSDKNTTVQRHLVVMLAGEIDQIV